MTIARWPGPIAALLVAGACKLDVPNFNAQSVTELERGASASAIATAAAGLLVASRDFETSFLSSHIATLGEMGRESIELDPSNPIHPVDRLERIEDITTGNAGWGKGYRLIKQGNVLLTAVATATGLSDAQKESVRGFVKTIQATAFIRLNNAFDASGLPIDVDRSTTAAPAPIASNPAVKTHIAQLLDQAKVHLLAGGTAFSFQLGVGFAGFDTPTRFLRVNRALRARMAAYQQDWGTVLTALGESFLDPSASLRLGVYDTYSTNSGDQPNPLFDPTCRQLFSIPQNRTDAQLQSDGVTPDRRYVEKIRRIPGLGPPPADRTIHGIVVSECFNIYSSASTPIPFIRNEELILLRAEARMQTGDRAGALADINLIRVNAGGLAPLAADPGDPGLLDEVLYNRRYSLIWEGGHRWVDMRRYGRLAQLPKLLPRHLVFPHLQLPRDECLPRTPQPPGCTAPPGI